MKTVTEFSEQVKVLDHGYIRYIGSMGSDENIIENARMSTGKGFFGWYWERDTYADAICKDCLTQHLWETLPKVDSEDEVLNLHLCTNCWSSEVYHFAMADENKQNFYRDVKLKLLGKKGQPRDISLLEFMYMNRHMTPFESGELCIEVYAPIMVYREWHRHRTQSYNEFSARYSQMPNEHYLPDLERIQKQSQLNKQGSGESFPPEYAKEARRQLKNEQEIVYAQYDAMIRSGVAKEVARINTPVSRYSKMRAKTDLRNWLGFLSLRMDNAAQWEIRQYANALATIIKALWPKTFDLFIEHEFLAVRFSRSEMTALRKLLGTISRGFLTEEVPLEPKKRQPFLDKLMKPKEDDYREVLAKLGY